MQAGRRRKKRPTPGLRVVDLSRGSSGYGFTISGQQPCILSSIVAGSPADRMGLKAGDFLMAVNSMDVSQADHDDVVRIIGSSVGLLQLQIAENINGSDSSEEDFHNKPKTKHPTRVRPPRPTGINRAEKVLADLHAGGIFISEQNVNDYAQNKYGACPKIRHNSVGKHNDGPLRYDWYDTNDQEKYHCNRNKHPSGSLKAQVGHSGPLKGHIGSNGHLKGHIGTTDRHRSNALRDIDPNSKQIHPDRKYQHEHFAMEDAGHARPQVRFTPRDLSNILSPSIQPHLGAGEQPIYDPNQPPTEANLRAVVGYIGSVEMPCDASLPKPCMQSIRSAIKRLRVEQKIHTLVLMEVYNSYVKLVDNRRNDIACYPAERLAFSGLCPDDKRFFGLVTQPDVRHQEDGMPSNSCHVFMVEPELTSHSVHTSKAKSFRIKCTMDVDSNQCQEFPRNPSPILQCIAALYQDHPGGIVEAELARAQEVGNLAAQRSLSNSSNSDSGLGFARDDAPPTDQARVCVVDLSGDANHPQGNYTPPPDQPLSQNKEQDFLNIRARPTLSPNSKLLNSQTDAENIRKSMQKILQSRQKQQSQTGYCSSDAESSHSIDNFPRGDRDNNLRGIRHLKGSNSTSRLHPGRQVNPDPADYANIGDPQRIHKLSARAITDSSMRAQGRSHSGDQNKPPIIPKNKKPDVWEVRATTTKNGKDDATVRKMVNKFEESSLDNSHMKSIIRSSSFSNNQSTEGPLFQSDNLAHSKPGVHNSVESLAVSDSGALPNTPGKMLAANSVASIASKRGEMFGAQVGRVASWAVSFEKCLEDPAGRATFTEFLKKEFSEENILFWTTCHKYKEIEDIHMRNSRAREIFTKHLSKKAIEPVNIDSEARKFAEDKLDAPTIDMFDMAQKQIFTLMKRDSYSRFLKSALYKDCIIAEMEMKELPFPGSPQKNDQNQGKELKKSHSASDAEGVDDNKRRRSLLPWSKSKRRLTKSPPKKNSKKEPKDVDSQTGSGSLARTNSLASSDLNVMSKEASTSRESLSKDGVQLADKENLKFCRIIMADGGTTVVSATPGETVRCILARLCEKRSLNVAAVDAYLLDSDKALDLNRDISSLGSQEIRIETRVMFRLDLPNRKSIGVKAKPNRTIRDVFKPILHKYGFKMDYMVVHVASIGIPLDMESLVSSIDNQRVIVQTMQDFAAKCGWSKRKKEWGVYQTPGKGDLGKPPVPRSRSFRQAIEKLEGVGDISTTSNVDDFHVLDVSRKSALDTSLGFFSRLRRNSWGDKDKEQAKLNNKNRVTFSSQQNLKAALPPNAKSIIKKDPEADKVFDLLSEAQSKRFDDQRGLLGKNLELPDFLKPKKRPKSDYVVGYTNKIPNMNSKSDTLLKRATDVNLPKESDSNDSEFDDNLKFADVSFGPDGVVPSHTEAELYFANSYMFPPGTPDCNDSRVMDGHRANLGSSYNSSLSSLENKENLFDGSYIFNGSNNDRASFSSFQGPFDNEQLSFANSEPSSSNGVQPVNAPRWSDPPQISWNELPQTERTSTLKNRSDSDIQKSSDDNSRDNSLNMTVIENNDMEATILASPNDSFTSQALPPPPDAFNDPAITREIPTPNFTPPPVVSATPRHLMASVDRSPYSRRYPPHESPYPLPKGSPANQTIPGSVYNMVQQPIILQSEDESGSESGMSDIQALDFNSETDQQRSPTSTPSPTTHHLVISSESSPEMRQRFTYTETTLPQNALMSPPLRKAPTPQKPDIPQKPKTTSEFTQSNPEVQITFV
ncbi:unnamed protein product [Owenia fusiformis]|uniref:Regulator of G-protein signaling 12 n=1 Tax=Owenia fusiformis TaxID=6347 RepID=A0A8S4NQ62_OWEFU|nr:unnamed protein product [Owenia fusiformis]